MKKCLSTFNFKQASIDYTPSRRFQFPNILSCARDILQYGNTVLVYRMYKYVIMNQNSKWRAKANVVNF